MLYDTEQKDCPVASVWYLATRSMTDTCTVCGLVAYNAKRYPSDQIVRDADVEGFIIHESCQEEL